MDSKLVVEQMSGRWKIKHPDMRPLAARAQQLAPPGTTYTWIPREQNQHADRILNEALDGRPRRRARPGCGHAPRSRSRRATSGRRLVAGRDRHHPRAGAPRRHRPHGRQAVLQRARRQQPRARRRGARADPGHRRLALAAGRAVRRRRHLAGAAHPRVGGDPRRAARPRAGHRGRARGDGVRQLGRAHVRRDQGALPRRPRRVAGVAGRAARRRRVVPAWCRSGCSTASAGCSRSTPAPRVLVVSHVTPIKVLVAHALGAPLESVFRMEMAPGVGHGGVVLRRRPGLAADVQRAVPPTRR